MGDNGWAERIGEHKNSFAFRGSDVFEGSLQVVCCSSHNRRRNKVGLSGCRSHLLVNRRMRRIGRHQDGYFSRMRQQCAKKLNRFGGQVDKHIGHAGDVTCRVRKRFHEPRTDWVSCRRHHDGNCPGCRLRCGNGRRCDGHNDVRLQFPVSGEGPMCRPGPAGTRRNYASPRCNGT
jgi:hypothetical protein